MRAALHRAGVAVLLGGPTVLAFFTGGYRDEARVTAALVAWALVLVAALAAPAPLPRSRPGLAALAGLVGLAAWTAISQSWAALSTPAWDDTQRLALYAGTLIAAAALLRPRAVARWAEPGLWLGATIVIGYALSERVLPGVIDLADSASAGGRIDQPLTYWNAMGALAATGLVLAARLAGDRTRPATLRALAAFSAPALATGLYLTFSRGALGAAVAGLLVLVACRPTPAQVRAVAVAATSGVLVAFACAPLDGVTRASGGGRARDGVVLLVVLVALGAAGALLARRPPAGDARRLPPRAHLVAGLAALAVIAAVVVVAGADKGPQSRNPAFGANASRLGSVETTRYAYWRVALDTFADHPLRGVGSGGFRVEWLQHRDVREPAKDAHSLYLETPAELGLVGLALLLLFVGGTALAARRALRRDPALVAGATAALATLALHAGIDWDWEMPALALVGVVLAGLLIAAADEPGAGLGDQRRLAAQRDGAGHGDEERDLGERLRERPLGAPERQP
jgi:O-Antigen ligase